MLRTSPLGGDASARSAFRLGILGCAVGLFAWGRLPTDIVGLLIVASLMITQVLSPAEALAGFGSPVVILIAAIFVVSAGLVNAGVTQFLGQFIVKLGGSNETRLIAMIMLLAGAVGSVLNSSAIVAMFIPVVLSIAAKTGLNKKRLLMPLGIAVMISGMMTLIASSTKVIVENVLKDQGVEPILGFFSFTPFGVVALVLAVGFMPLVGRNMLSNKRTGADGADAPGAADLIAAYGLANRWHRLVVTDRSPLIGQSAAAVRLTLNQRYDVDLLGFERKDRQRSHFSPADPESVIDSGDVLFTLIDDSRIPEVTAALACSVAGAMPEGERQKMLQDIGVAEVMPAPESTSLGVPLARLDFPSAFNLTVLGLRHRGRSVSTDLADHRLDFGDTVLIGGNWHDIHQLSEDRRNFLLLNLPAECQDRLTAPGRAPVSIGILVLMVAAMATQILPNVAIALIAALAMVGTRADCAGGDRGGAGTPGVAAGLRDDRGHCLLGSIRDAGVLAHQHADHGTGRLPLRRLRQGRPAHVGPDDGVHGHPGQVDIPLARWPSVHDSVLDCKCAIRAFRAPVPGEQREAVSRRSLPDESVVDRSPDDVESCDPVPEVTHSSRV